MKKRGPRNRNTVKAQIMLEITMETFCNSHRETDVDPHHWQANRALPDFHCNGVEPAFGYHNTHNSLKQPTMLVPYV